MTEKAAITVETVGKTYRIWESPSSRLTAPMMEGLAGCLPDTAAPTRWLRQRAGLRYHDFHALQDVSLQVHPGECVGIIGRNGSGKSTLLQIIAGTMQPTAGSVRVQGRVAALLELGAGFNPEFTGRENVFLNAAVLGLSKTETESRFPEIAAFAEIGDFIDQPVKTYSSGMMVRLAFAVQTAVNPEILIVDEALSVGDFFFQQKCFKRIAELRTAGTTILFVSHDMGSVRDLCERTLYLKQGRTMILGDTQSAIAAYFAEGQIQPPPAAVDPAPSPAEPALVTASSFEARALWSANQVPENAQAGVGRLLGVAVLDESGLPVTGAKIGQLLRLQALFSAEQDGSYHVTFELKNRYDQVVTSLSSYTCGLPPLALAAGQSAIMELSIRLTFEAGLYSCQAALASAVSQANRATRLDASPWLGPITINWDYENERAPFLGMFGPEAQARFIHDQAH
jgi:lipopolysaccharide transport system ATP-binding protein